MAEIGEGAKAGGALEIVKQKEMNRKVEVALEVFTLPGMTTLSFTKLIKTRAEATDLIQGKV